MPNKLTTEERSTLAELLFPQVGEFPADILAKYPSRNLPPEAKVTRLAPSPTGFMHLGSLLAAIISERIARQTGGIFYLRIEDTDRKREVVGTDELIINSLKKYDVRVDEGETTPGQEVGAYGPYRQSARQNIYQVFIKDLIRQGLAYPCFLNSEDLEKINSEQELAKIRPGIRGKWATWRDRSRTDIESALAKNRPYTIRFYSEGDFDNHKIKVVDLVKGERELSENDIDVVIMKQDGLPTYHFAHIIDDHLMGTTDVLRGDEWFSSVALHHQLFAAMNWSAPRYGHISPIQKKEGETRRKLSKRKDVEASMNYYDEQGYPPTAVIEYLLNLANSDFEDWRKANPTADNREFNLRLEKLGHSGALFDFKKLEDISKNKVAQMTAEEVFIQGLSWAERQDKSLAVIIAQYPSYTREILAIERQADGLGRKDIGKWSDLRPEIGYFFDELFDIGTAKDYLATEGVGPEIIKTVTNGFLETFNIADDKDTWFAKIKQLAKSLGYAETMKEYKAAPADYKGSVTDIAKIIRVLTTGRTQSPDLWQIMQVMGEERIRNRLAD